MSTVTEADMKAAHAVVDGWYLSKAAVFGEIGDTSLSARIAQAIATARATGYSTGVDDGLMIGLGVGESDPLVAAARERIEATAREAGATATAGPADAAAPTQAAPVSPETHAFVGEGSATGYYLGRCRECHCEPSAPIHAVPGAAK